MQYHVWKCLCHLLHNNLKTVQWVNTLFDHEQIHIKGERENALLIEQYSVHIYLVNFVFSDKISHIHSKRKKSPFVYFFSFFCLSIQPLNFSTTLCIRAVLRLPSNIYIPSHSWYADIFTLKKKIWVILIRIIFYRRLAYFNFSPLNTQLFFLLQVISARHPDNKNVDSSEVSGNVRGTTRWTSNSADPPLLPPLVVDGVRALCCANVEDPGRSAWIS